MEHKHKTLYETPEAEVVNIKIGKCIMSVEAVKSVSRKTYDYYDLDDPNQNS